MQGETGESDDRTESDRPADLAGAELARTDRSVDAAQASLDGLGNAERPREAVAEVLEEDSAHLTHRHAVHPAHTAQSGTRANTRASNENASERRGRRRWQTRTPNGTCVASAAETSAQRACRRQAKSTSSGIARNACLSTTSGAPKTGAVSTCGVDVQTMVER